MSMNFEPSEEVAPMTVLDSTGSTLQSNVASSNEVASTERDGFVDEEAVSPPNSVNENDSQREAEEKTNTRNTDSTGSDSPTQSTTGRTYQTSMPFAEAVTSDSSDNVALVPDRYLGKGKSMQKSLPAGRPVAVEESIDFNSNDFRNTSEESSVDFSSRSYKSTSMGLTLKNLKTRRHSIQKISQSTKFTNEVRQGKPECYPGDCYSFMMIHSPFKNPFYFFFGFTVFAFQILFLLYMVLNKLDRNMGVNGEVDNPSQDFLANFIPSNVSSLVRATQITAVLSYCMFADSSLKDCVTAVEKFPRFKFSKPGDNTWLAVVASVLRFAQGFMAILATFLLIVTTSDVIEIILNFAAVNFISTLDEVAFELAKWGKYGPSLEKEAKSIEQRPIPYCIYRKYKHVRFYWTVVPIAIILITLTISISILQESESNWVTQMFRVQFQGSTGLEHYSGCYVLDPDITHNKRSNYNSFGANEEPAILGYCKESRQWILFKDNGDESQAGGPTKDACKVDRELELARSGSTDYFDISSSYDDSWYSASGKPLELFFFDSDGVGTDLEGQCGSFLNNGYCDVESFNKLDFQYDGGDCCAATCTQGSCGLDGAKGAFGVNDTEGIGYRNCIDPDMVPVTFVLKNITSSRNPSVLEVTKNQENEYFREKDIDFWKQDPVTPYFTVDCDGKDVLSIYIEKAMEEKSETIHVKDGAHCVVSVSNTTGFEQKWDNDPIWWVEYDIYHGDINDTEIKITSGNSAVQSKVAFSRIPECYFDELGMYFDRNSAYSDQVDSTLALDWLVIDDSGNSKCDDSFLIERFALASLNFAAPMKDGLEIQHSNSSDTESYNVAQYNEDALWINAGQQCRWDNIACQDGSVETLAVRSENLYGTISTEVGLLTGLRRLDYDANGLIGTIPTEIGLLINLQGFDIDNQKISGTIPTEFGKLVNMRELDLDKNRLTGTIPTEFGLMADANEFDLIYNQLSGPIPTELGELENMKVLGFDGNMLSGPIPSEIGRMKNLQQLHFNENKITGSIPRQLGSANLMEELWLQDNSMTGIFPRQLGNLGSLYSLNLKNNLFRGTIPTQIGFMTSLHIIDLRENSFTGQIPSEIGYLTDLEVLRLEGNNFEGTIPFQIKMLQRLRIFTFDSNVEGAIPSDIRTLNPCILCEGGHYNLTEQYVYSDEILYYENGEYGKIVEHSCRSLLKEHWDYPEEPFSANACTVLKETCVTCGSGPYQDGGDKVHKLPEKDDISGR